MEKEYFSLLKSFNYSVLYIDDYSSFELDFEKIKSYKKIFVLAYSLGVFAFSKVQKNIKNIEKITVVNGTCKPISSSFGIDDKVFQGTIDNFNEIGKLKFLKRVIGNSENFNKIKDIPFSKNANVQKDELTLLKKEILTSKENYFKPNTVFISEKDRIFLPNNQKNYWKNENIVLLQGLGHFPFLNFEYFDEFFK